MPKQRKEKKFHDFKKNYLTESERVSKKELKELTEFEYFVFGSDQIWNPNITNGFDDVYFGSFTRNAAKISYAASIGLSELNDKQEMELSKLLSSIDCISVREEKAKELVNSITNKEVNVVLDPTFLVDKEVWESIEIKPKERNYILVYKLENNRFMMKSVEKLAEIFNLNVIEISSLRNKPYSKKSHKLVTDCGPNELLGYFSNAEMVITNSFHGTAFSIIFEKNFYTFAHSKVPSRMEDLLNKLGLIDRLINYDGEISSSKEVDYEKVNNHLKIHRDQSINYLKNSLLDLG